jgi:hypothetical protein
MMFALQGNRDNIDSMASGSQKVLGQVLKLIDLYDLYGSVAYPKVNSPHQGAAVAYASVSAVLTGWAVWAGSRE